MRCKAHWMSNRPNFIPTWHRVQNIPLERCLNAIKTDAVMPTAHQRDIFSVRPAKGHRGAGGATWFHVGAWLAAARSSRRRQIRSVPQLFGEHAALVRKIFHRGNQGLWIASRSQLVMASFACQNRPATTHAGSVVGAAIVLLTVAVVIVTTPARALRQLMFNHAVDHF